MSKLPRLTSTRATDGIGGFLDAYLRRGERFGLISTMHRRPIGLCPSCHGRLVVDRAALGTSPAEVIPCANDDNEDALDEKAVRYCEEKFGNDPTIKNLMQVVDYGDMTFEQKPLLWKMQAPYLLKRYNYVVPGTGNEPELSEEEKARRRYEQARKQEKALQKSINDLRRMNILRVYLADFKLDPTNTCSILNALPARGVGPPCHIPKAPGPLRLVKYASDHANYAAVEFDEDCVGLTTTAMGDCIGVMCWIGQQYQGKGYWGGSLAHLPGGDAKGLDWKKMVLGLTPTELRKGISSDPLYAQALICVRPDRLGGSDTVRNIIEKHLIPLGFSPPQIMVYVGMIPGFTILWDGRFGTTNE